MTSDPTAARNSRIPVTAYAFAVIGLLGLSIIPYITTHILDKSRAEDAQTFTPAEPLARQLRFLYEYEVAEHRGFGLTRNPAAAHRYQQARAAEERAYNELEPLVQRIGPGARFRFHALRNYAARWHVLDDAVITNKITGNEYGPHVAQQNAIRDSTLAAAVGLDDEINNESETKRAKIRAIVDSQRWFSIGLGIVGLITVGIVGWFGKRERDLSRSLSQAVERETALREVSEQRRAELERVTESRARLMRGFSHDVKNPLGAADGYLQLLEHGMMDPLTPNQDTTVKKARRSIDASLHLIHDLLELSRTESSEISIEHSPISVRDIAGDIVEEYRAQAENKGLAIKFEMQDNVSTLESDEKRIRQILGNLISNAVKYSDSGQIRVCVRAHSNGSAPPGSDWIAIDVSDPGHGIPHDKQALVFEEFVRLDPDASRGAGVGLAISRRIARALGGDITLQSEIDHGSTFTLLLPAKPAAGRP